MSRDLERHHSLTRRALFLGGLNVLGAGILAARLSWLQVFQADRYKTLSDQNRISLRLLPAPRGVIIDRFGVPMATNTQNFRAFLVAEQAQDVEETLARVSRLTPLSEEQKQDILAGIRKVRKFMPVLVKENLSWDELSAIELHLPDLPGIRVEEGEIRAYPLGPAAAHVIGYVGLVSEAEKTDDPLMLVPGFRIGKGGIEKGYDLPLRGEAGATQTEVNVVGREIRELSRKNGSPGKRVTLTIDTEMQIFTQRRLEKERSASAVLLDVHSGEIYALCSSPSFDPNVFARGISVELWEELLADDARPLNNKAISGQYPPGSTFKMVTALAALEEAAATETTTVYCPGHYELGNARFHCWKKGGHGTMNMVSALAQSCDTYFYEVSRRTGIDKIAEVARRLGLGEKLGLDMPGEAAGLVPTRDWKMAELGQKWQLGETVVAAIGQGYMQATPLQLAIMTARLVNGGRAVTPKIVAATGADIPPAGKTRALDLNPQHLSLVLRGMDAVVNGDRGTAAASRIREKPYSMGGKTGTAQVRRITARQRALKIENKDLPWPQRHHALFVGYGPVENPRYACAVVVEHGVSGSGAAAPIAKEILLKAQQRDLAARPTILAIEGAAESAPVSGAAQKTIGKKTEG